MDSYIEKKIKGRFSLSDWQASAINAFIAEDSVTGMLILSP